MTRVIGIFGPASGVGFDIPPSSVELAIIPDDPLEVVSLPERPDMRKVAS
jgi:hypothetical protein